MTVRMRIRDHEVKRNCTDNHTEYGKYKAHLRTDFHGHCGYCDDYDGWVGGVFSYHIDHFAPKSKFPHICASYDNLVYSCPYCNRGKGDYWPSTDETVSVVGDEGVVNPISPEYHDHIQRDANGRIVSDSKLGKFMIKRMHLYLERHRVLWNLTRINAIIKQVGEAIDTMDLEGDVQLHALRIHFELSKEFHKYLDYLLVDIASGERR